MDQAAFFVQYAKSYKKMTAIGQNLMSSIHLQVPRHENLEEEGGIEKSETTTTEPKITIEPVTNTLEVTSSIIVVSTITTTTEIEMKVLHLLQVHQLLKLRKH
jgi:hypothetical protein